MDILCPPSGLWRPSLNSQLVLLHQLLVLVLALVLVLVPVPVPVLVLDLGALPQLFQMSLWRA